MFDPRKPTKTRDGREWRFYADDGGDDFPIHGAFRVGGGWVTGQWSTAGRYLSNEEYSRDLINIPETVEAKGWLNVYPDGLSVLYSTKDTANHYAVSSRIACVPINLTVTVGEGLEEK